MRHENILSMYSKFKHIANVKVMAYFNVIMEK